MIQLSIRTYTRSELEAIFHTSRTDTMRRRLTRAGYSFKTMGRGQSYTIEIIALPESPGAFERFAMREFGCGPQTNFKAMREHLFLLFYDPEYQFLPSNHQARYLETLCSLKVSDQSLRNWKNLLIKRNWIAIDEDKVKYCLCRKGKPPLEITKKEYLHLWHRYFALINNGIDRGTALHMIYEERGRMPRRQCGFTENALNRKELEELRWILEESS